MKLYWFGSTNPQKVRLALEELGLDYELIEVDLYRGAPDEELTWPPVTDVHAEVQETPSN